MANLAAYLGPSLAQPPAKQPLALQRVELVIFSLIALTAFWETGELLGIPPVGAFSASLLQHPGGLTNLAALAGLLILLTAIFSLPRSRIASDAPLACAALGLGAISWRGGPMQDTLFAADSSAIFIKLACELLLLFVALLIARRVSVIILGHRWPDHGPKPQLRPHAIVLHAVITGLLVMAIARSDAKAQVLCAILIASAVASIVCSSMMSELLAVECWLGPLLAGLVGYISAYVATPPELLHIGMAGGWTALARPLPLDWAAFGTIGSIIGFWIARDLEAVQNQTESPAAA
jgi:hypothetical protein